MVNYRKNRAKPTLRCVRCAKSRRYEGETICAACRTYLWQRTHPDEYRAHNQNFSGGRKELRYARHGITERIYLDLLAAQGDKCAICLTEEPGGRWGVWQIDHDHACCLGTYGCAACVRGLLCALCNQLLGHAKDSPDALRAAIVYLEETGCVRLPTTSRAWT